MAWLAFHFTVNPPEPGSEILMASIADLGFESFDQHENGFTAFIKDEGKGFRLNDFSFEDFTFSYTIEKIEDRNWNDEWEKNFDPVRVGDLLLIRAPFHPSEEGYAQEIIITPKMSFGTGHHQTTRLMCRALFETDLKNKRVLDMGSGTGVLAILAARLGAIDLLAVDIDDWCVENAIENCEMNGVSFIRVRKGDIDALENEPPFDLILANINKNVLKRHLPFYAKLMKQQASLLLSGFFVHDADELTDLGKTLGLSRRDLRSEGEWCMLKLQKD